jgi:GT2 family glycosyltransferase
MTEDVFISILNWNGRELLRDCLDSLFAVTEYDAFEVVVVDNGSDDGSVEMLREEYPSVHRIENDENRGFAKGHNQAIEFSLDRGADQVLLLNNDVELVDPGWLDELVDVTTSDEEVGLVGCRVVEPDGSVHYDGRNFPFDRFLFPTLSQRYDYNRYQRAESPEEYEYVDDVLGAVFMIDAEVLEAIGGLDEAYSPVYREESDYCVRVWDAGYRTAYTDATEVVHVGQGSSEKLDGLWLEYVRQRNIFRFVLTNYPPTWILLGAPMMLLRGSLFALDVGADGVSVREDFLADPVGAVKYALLSYVAVVAASRDIVSKRRGRDDVEELVK